MGIFSVFERKKAALFSGTSALGSFCRLSHGRAGGPVTGSLSNEAVACDAEKRAESA